jgi:hypothetical protein
VYPWPGNKIILFLAPAPRMAVTTVWTVAAHLLISGIS